MVDASAQPVACNFRSFESMDYESRDLTDSILLTNVGEQDEDGFYATLHPEKAIYLHCRNLDIDIRNIHLVIEGYREGAPIPYYTVTPVISDAGNQNSYTCPQKLIYTHADTTAYIPMNPSGNCSYVRLEIKGSIDRFAVRALTCNTPRPFDFSVLRFALVLLALCIGYALRPRSPLYRTTMEEFGLRHRLITLGTAGGFCLLLFAVIASRGGFLSLMAPWQAQYQHLADAFLNGQLHLFRETPPDS